MLAGRVKVPVLVRAVCRSPGLSSITAWSRDSRLYPWRVSERPTLRRLGSNGKPTSVPVDYTAKHHQLVLEAVARGIKRKHAAAVAGVCESTFERWYEKGRLIVELLERETMIVDGERMPVAFPEGQMLAYYNLYLDLRQAEAMSVVDATNAVSRHVTGYTVPGEWVEEQEAVYYLPTEPEFDVEDPYKIKRVHKRQRWISPRRVDGDSGMAWRVLQRLDPDPKQGGSLTVNVDRSTTTVDARKVEVYGFDLAAVAESQGLDGLRALAGDDDLGELLEG